MGSSSGFHFRTPTDIRKDTQADKPAHATVIAGVIIIIIIIIDMFKVA